MNKQKIEEMFRGTVEKSDNQYDVYKHYDYKLKRIKLALEETCIKVFDKLEFIQLDTCDVIREGEALNPDYYECRLFFTADVKGEVERRYVAFKIKTPDDFYSKLCSEVDNVYRVLQYNANQVTKD